MKYEQHKTLILISVTFLLGKNACGEAISVFHLSLFAFKVCKQLRGGEKIQSDSPRRLVEHNRRGRKLACVDVKVDKEDREKTAGSG